MILSRSVLRLGQYVACGCLLVLPALAQTAASPTEPTSPNDNIVQMSSFEVTTTQGKGYMLPNAAHGFKTDQSLMEIPQADIVLTNDLIEDLSFNNATDMLMFVGIQGVFEGETAAIRGNRVSAPWIDDMPDGRVFEDEVFVDSVEVIKGPTAVLYPNASLNGIIIKASKKPLPFEQLIVSEKIDEWGISRTVVDYNKPIGMLGDVKVSFRFIAAYQFGNSYFTNVKLDSYPIHPAMEFDYKNTTLRIFYDFDDLPNHDEQEYGLVRPDGSLVTAPDRPRSSVGMVPGNDTHYESAGFRVELLQKYSQDWETRTQAMEYHLNRWGADVRPSGNVNYQNQTMTYNSFLDNEPQDYWVLTSDTQGKYTIGPIPMQTTAGYDVIDTVSENRITTLFNPGYGFGTNDTVTVPYTSQTAINALVVPNYQAYRPLPNYTRSKANIENVYVQQQIDVVPGWLTVVGGWTFENLEQVNVTNAALAVTQTVGGVIAPLYPGTYTAQDVTGSHFIHRFGGILHLGKQVMLYAMTATQFSPSAGVDYYNNRLPSVVGEGSEVGIKTAFLDGRLSSTFSLYHEALTNQAIVAGGTNIQGVGYNIAIGSTTQQGFDGDVTMELAPGWALIATFFKGTSTSAANNSIEISDTYDNSWSVFTRYDFKSGPMRENAFLKGLGIGGGVSRIGSFWIAPGAYINSTLPNGGFASNQAIKFKEGSLVDLFADYRISKHWLVKLNVVNLLNENFPETGQGANDIDPSPPLTFAGTLEYRF